MPVQLLEGIRVIELTQYIAGPFCAKLLADYGAEVIKIEEPGVGDLARHEGPFPQDLPHPEKSGLFLHLNANKKGITLDLKGATGQGLFKRLIETSDILVESLSPGEMATLGLGYDTLGDINPRLVMTSVTPFGQTGPYRDYQATELTLFAMTGAMYREGVPEREPLKYGGEIAHYFGGCAAAAVTVAATFRALLTGRGEWIDVSMLECMAGHPHQIGRRLPFAYSGDTDPRRSPHSPILPGVAPYAAGTFRCRDGHVTFLPLGPRMWPYIARMVGMPSLVDDPRFRTPQDRLENQAQFDAIFQPWLDVNTKEEVFVAAQQAGVPCSPVLTPPEIISSPHFQERGFFIDIDHPDAGTLTYPGLPFNVTDAHAEAARPAPRLGEHNEQVYCGMLGLECGQLAMLRNQGVI